MEAVEGLLQLLHQIVEKHGGLKPQIVGHSQGGRIIYAAMQALGPERASQLIHSAVFVAAPLTSGYIALNAIHDGVVWGFNRTLISPSVVATYPSSFSFLPYDEKDAQSAVGGIRDEHRQPVLFDWFNPDDWEKHQIGVFSFKQPISAEFRDHFRHLLTTAKRFARLAHGLDAKPPEELKAAWPPCAVFMADCHPTRNLFVKTEDQKKRGWGLTTDKSKPGDGTVCFQCCTPKHLPHRLYLAKPGTRTNHSDLPSNTEYLARILRNLIAEEAPKAPLRRGSLKVGARNDVETDASSMTPL